jgi:Protein of unknown function (DUF669)
MADLEFTFDATQVEPNTEFEVIPAGKYHVQIVNSEMRDNRNTSGRHLWLEMSIMDGPYADRRLFDRLHLQNSNEKAVQIAQARFSGICRAAGKLKVKDSEELHHYSMIANVRLRQAGPDKNKVHREAANEIGGYYPMNGTHQPAAAVSSRPATAAQAATATPQPATPPWKRNSGAPHPDTATWRETPAT